ncbi:MAG TPA: VWA domain-containing protein [Vicinamibacteria bacterium]|nr:VWA domain-containing protein [Vicinamibacteria bacterium]
MKRFPSSCLALAAATLLGASPLLAQAQSPPPKPFTLEVDVDVVSVTAVVFDKGGHLIRGLGPKDVELYEDGVRQEVSYFREASGEGERIPLSVILVLDTSGSMTRTLPFLQEAALSLIYKLDDVDRALLVQFNETIKGSTEFTGDTSRLENIVQGLQAWGGTSLYDAIQYSLGRIKDQPGRKAVVVFTDGADTTSQLKEQDVIDYAREVEATVYSVGFKGESGLFARSPRGFLRKIAQETGGAFFFPDKVGDLIRVFNEISNELKNHYLLAYSPKRLPDGTWRTIELRLARKDAEVRVRKGYYAVKHRRVAPPTAPP